MQRRNQPRIVKKTNSQTILEYKDTHGTQMTRFFHSIIFFVSAINGLSLFFLWLLLDIFWIAATYISDESHTRWTLSIFTMVIGFILIIILTLTHYCFYKISFRDLFVRMRRQMLDANHSENLTQINVDNHSFFTEIRQLQWAFFDLVERLQIYRGYVPSQILHRLDSIVEGTASPSEREQMEAEQAQHALTGVSGGMHQNLMLSEDHSFSGGGKPDSSSPPDDSVSYENIQSFRSPHASWRTSDSHSYISSRTSISNYPLPGQIQQNNNSASCTALQNAAAASEKKRDSSSRASLRTTESLGSGSLRRFLSSREDIHRSSWRSLRNSCEGLEMGLRSVDATVMSLRILNLSSLMDSPDIFVKQFEKLTTTVNRLLRISKGQSASFDISQMIFFWTSTQVRNHEVRACDTIRRIVKQVQEMNQDWVAQKGYTPLEIGIGASTGPSLVGNVGCESDMKTFTIYSKAHDRAVSFAGLCSKWDAKCIIDKQVFVRVRYHFVTRPLTFRHCVHSCRHPTEVQRNVHAFELGQKIEMEENEWMYTLVNQINASVWDQYNQAFDYYVSGPKFHAQALQVFRQHLEACPHDVATKKWISFLEEEENPLKPITPRTVKSEADLRNPDLMLDGSSPSPITPIRKRSSQKGQPRSNSAVDRRLLKRSASTERRSRIPKDPLRPLSSHQPSSPRSGHRSPLRMNSGLYGRGSPLLSPPSSPAGFTSFNRRFTRRASTPGDIQQGKRASLEEKAKNVPQSVIFEDTSLTIEEKVSLTRKLFKNNRPTITKQSSSDSQLSSNGSRSSVECNSSNGSSKPLLARKKSKSSSTSHSTNSQSTTRNEASSSSIDNSQSPDADTSIPDLVIQLEDLQNNDR